MGRASYFVQPQHDESTIPRAEWDAWYSDIEAARAKDAAIYAMVNGPARKRTEPGTIRCHHCEGTGQIQYDAGFTDQSAVCDCPDCHGTGWRR